MTSTAFKWEALWGGGVERACPLSNSLTGQILPGHLLCVRHGGYWGASLHSNWRGWEVKQQIQYSIIKEAEAALGPQGRTWELWKVSLVK